MSVVSAVAASHVGNVRPNNEDNFFLNGKVYFPKSDTSYITDESTGGLYAVCDGMGGDAHGELASKIAVTTLSEFFEEIYNSKDSFDKAIARYTESANARICEIIEQNGQRMGTTLALLYLRDEHAIAANIGDSRVYYFKKNFLRENQLIQLSKDHNQIRQLIELGVITREDAKTHPARHTLTQHLGIFSHEMIVEPFISLPVKLKRGDIFLLCSDGLTDMLENDEITSIMSAHSELQKTAEMLIDAALRNGGHDNVTVVLVGT